MKLDALELAAIAYHDIFDYPLTPFDLIRWQAGKKVKAKNLRFAVAQERGYLFIKGREGLIYKRIRREKNFGQKRQIAQSAARVLARLPSVKGVALTGSLAMANSDEAADIDLLIITQKGTLWTSRPLCFLLLKLAGIPTRRFGDTIEKDKICLNLWLDETALVWPKSQRNVYTAHEIAQLIPLVSKDGSLENFLWQNRWIKGFWPNAAVVKKSQPGKRSRSFLRFFEPMARTLQFLRMRPKITREKVTRKKALFHPQDWSEIVLQKFYP